MAFSLDLLNAQSTAAISPEENVMVSQIILETYAAATAATDALDVAQRKTLRWYLLVYTATPDEVVKLHEGKTGKDYDQERDRIETAQKIRFLLGFPYLAETQLKGIAARINAFRGRGADDPFGVNGNGGQSGSYAPVITVW